MQRSGLRIYTGLMLIGMLAALALLTNVHLNKKPQAFGRYIMTDLGRFIRSSTMARSALPPVNASFLARNHQGQTVGWEMLSGGRGAQAILLDHGKSRDLGTLGGKVSYPIAINDAGEIAGYSARADYSLHAFLWRNGSMQDLGTLGGRNSWVWDLDAQGRVVGEADTASGATQAFLYHKGIMIDLGTLGGGESAAHGINDRGQIVGEAETSLGDLHAFLYNNGVMIDLNKQTTLPPGWVLSSATKIDDAGRIWGEGYYHNAPHSFLLTPAV